MSSSIVYVEVKDFEDFQDHDDDYYSDSENQSPPKHSKDDTITFYKSSLDNLGKRIKKLRGEILYYQKLQTQLSLLLNKAVEDQYGKIIVEPPVLKPLIAPLPPILKTTQHELISLFHKSTPDEMEQYIQNSSLIEQLIFTDATVFDDKFLENLMRVSPDLRVSFFKNTILQLKRCGEVIHQLLPVMSRSAESSILQDQIKSLEPNTHQFFLFHDDILQKLAKIIGCEICKVVYLDRNENFLYPQEKGFNIFSMSGSFCGSIFSKSEDISIIHEPTQNIPFDHANEKEIFGLYPNAMAIRLSSADRRNTGLLIFLSHSEFSNTNQAVLSFVASYTGPLLHLFRSVFIQIAPSHFVVLAASIAKLRMVTDLIPCLIQELCELTGCQSAHILLSKPESGFPNLPIVSQEKSLVLNAINAKAMICLSNPRKLPDFNPTIDDEPSLGKISSMLITPIPETNLIIVLYNSTKGTQFTPIQQTITESFGKSLPPVLYRATMKNKIAQLRKESAADDEIIKSTMESLNPIIKSIKSNTLFTYLKQKLPQGVHIYLFIFLSDEEVLRFPDLNVFAPTPHLKDIKESRLVQEDINFEIECGGNTETKGMIVVPSHGPNRVVCIFFTEDISIFNDTTTKILIQLANNLILIAPWEMLETQAKDVGTDLSNITNALRFSLSSLNDLVDIDTVLQPESSKVEEGAFSVDIKNPDNTVEKLVSKDTDLGEDEKHLLENYSDFITYQRSMKKAPENYQEFIPLLNNLKVKEILKCNDEQLDKWLNTIATLFATNDIKFSWKANAIQIVLDIIRNSLLKTFFTDEIFLMLALVILLNGIQDIWTCTIDTSLLTLLNSMNFPPSKKYACSYIASVFSFSFGLSQLGKSQDQNARNDEIDLAKHLITILANMVVTNSMSFEASVLSHSRSISLTNYVFKEDNYQWIGRAMVMLSPMEPLIRDVNEAAHNLLNVFGDHGRKRELFRAERIYIPLIGYFTPKNNSIQYISNKLRDGIKEGWKNTRSSNSSVQGAPA